MFLLIGERNGVINGKERKTELAKVTYTYKQISAYKVEQLYSKNKKINRICAKEINDVDTSNMLNIKLNSTEEKGTEVKLIFPNSSYTNLS